MSLGVTNRIDPDFDGWFRVRVGVVADGDVDVTVAVEVSQGESGVVAEVSFEGSRPKDLGADLFDPQQGGHLEVAEQLCPRDTLQFSDDFVAGHGFGGDWYYSLTMARAPLVFAHEVEDISEGQTNPGWVFRGVRVPVVLGYEFLVSQRSSFNTVFRFHPLNFMNEGSWYAELHPTYVTRMGKNTRIALGVNLVMPGNPLPIADEKLSARVEKEETNLHIRGWEDWFPALPVAPLPYVGVYWVF